MRKAEGRNLESRYEKAIMGEPAPARSVTVGRSGPRAGNGPGTPVPESAHGARRQKKRVSIFDEQSRYVIENTGLRLQTKPNKADFGALSATQILLPGKMAG